MTDSETRAAVRETYAAAARRACCGEVAADQPVAATLYDRAERDVLPDAAVSASLGCANPVALAELRPGETVLDLGSGGGIDVLLSARRVGPEGLVYGLDMTDEMLELAERNRRAAGAENVRFVKGAIEEIPLPDESVDVIVSNCVVNLSDEKDRVFREARRVLRPGGRLALADIVTRGDLSRGLQHSLAAWAGCIAGALDVEEIPHRLRAAGFEEPTVQIVRTYGLADLEMLDGSALANLALDQLLSDELAAAEGRLASAFIRARRPGG